MKKYFIKAVSVILCLSIVMSCAVLAFAAENEKYNGKILMAINTDYKTQTGKDGYLSAYCASAQEGGKNTEDGVQPDFTEAVDDVIGDIIAASPEEYREYLRTHKDEPQAIISNDYKVGDIKRIYAIHKVETEELEKRLDEYGDETFESSENLRDYIIDSIKEFKELPQYIKEINEIITDYFMVDVKCIYVGEACTVWSQIDKDGTPHNTTEEAKEAAQVFDDVYKAEQKLFGPNVIDTDGDGKFALFAYDFEPDDNLAGYYANADTVNKFGFAGNVLTSSAIFSNHMDCAYFDTKYLDDASTIIHEYQHYLFQCTKLYGKNNFNYASYNESYVTEGFSRCAETIFADRYIGAFSSYASSADDVSFIKWSSYEKNIHSYYDVNAGFFNYLRNRYAILTGNKSEEYAGKDLFLEFHRRRNISNMYYSMEILGEIIYPADKYPDFRNNGERAKQLLIDFWTAVLLNEKSGIYGFNGEDVVNIDLSWLVESRLPSAKGTIRPGMAKFYYIDSGKTASAVIKEKSDNIYLEAFAGCTLTYDYNNPDNPDSYKEHYAKTIETTAIGCNQKRIGYYFSGWSEDKNAAEPEYLAYNELRFEKDTVLYAVWKEAPVVTTGRDYTPEDFDGETSFVFVPEEDGYYTFTKTNPKTYYEQDNLRLNGFSYYERSYSCYDSGTKTGEFTFSLTAGEKCQFEISDGSDFRIDKETESHTLTFMADGEIYCSYSGRTKYRFYADDWHALDYVFRGWSLDSNSESPEYIPDNYYDIEISQDTVIYAVINPCEEINGEGSVNFEREFRGQDINYAFTPETDGTYEIEVEGGDCPVREIFVEVYDENGRCLGNFSRDPSEHTGAFAGGHKYYIKPNFPVDGFTIKKLSDKISTKFLLKNNDKVVYSDSGKPFYTIPEDAGNSDGYRGSLEGWEDYKHRYRGDEAVFVLRGDEKLFAMYSRPYIYPDETFKVGNICFNKADNRYYAFIPLRMSSLFKITPKGGNVRVENGGKDNERRACFRNTDDGLLVCPQDERYKNDVLIIFDASVTEFTVEIVDAPVTVTYSAEGAKNVPAPQTINGQGYIAGEEPQKENQVFMGWKYEYTCGGKTLSATYNPGDKIFAEEDITLTAVFKKKSLLDTIRQWFEDIGTELSRIITIIINFLTSIF